MNTLTITDIAQLQNMTYIIFSVGIIVGLACSHFLKTILGFFDLCYRHPSRIKTNEGYLYRFNGKYVTLQEKNTLIKLAIEKHRAIKKRQNMTRTD